MTKYEKPSDERKRDQHNAQARLRPFPLGGLFALGDAVLSASRTEKPHRKPKKPTADKGADRSRRSSRISEANVETIVGATGKPLSRQKRLRLRRTLEEIAEEFERQRYYFEPKTEKQPTPHALAAVLDEIARCASDLMRAMKVGGDGFSGTMPVWLRQHLAMAAYTAENPHRPYGELVYFLMDAEFHRRAEARLLDSLIADARRLQQLVTTNAASIHAMVGTGKRHRGQPHLDWLVGKLGIAYRDTYEVEPQIYVAGNFAKFLEASAAVLGVPLTKRSRSALMGRWRKPSVKSVPTSK